LAAIEGRQYTLSGTHSKRGFEDYPKVSEARVSFTAAAGVHLDVIMKPKNP
jgi:hypothetical protein